MGLLPMNPSNRSGSKRTWAKGFTLIELLVVIAIIALLASLFLPALSGSKRATQTAACKTRLRQIGIAISLYTADFAVYPNAPIKLDRYLSQNRSYAASTNTQSTQSTLHSDGPVLLQCPTKLFYWLNLYGSVSWPQDQAKAQTNQSLGLALTCPTDPVYGPYLPDDSITAPAETFASGDTSVSSTAGPAQDAFFVRGSHFRPQYAHRPNRDYPDLGIANMLFCDGHVEDGRKTVWEARTEMARRRWNRDHQPHNEEFVQ
jgi:prepilin-type N-terminal cleavage/methylation domain-containing protein/prepilin-type processing-associated H-X9-DG protein